MNFHVKVFFPATRAFISLTSSTTPLVLFSLRINSSSLTKSPSVCESPPTATSTVGSAFAIWNVSSIFFVVPFFAVRISVVFTFSAAFSGIPERMPSSSSVKPSGSLLSASNWNCIGFKSAKFLIYTVKSNFVFF